MQCIGARANPVDPAALDALRARVSVRFGLWQVCRVREGECRTVNRRTMIAATLGFAALPNSGLAAEFDPIIIDAINRYFEKITTLQGDFTERRGDSAQVRGRFFVSRPGRLHLDFFDAERTLIVSDGVWLATIGRESGRFRQSPLRSTPLFPFLQENSTLR